MNTQRKINKIDITKQRFKDLFYGKKHLNAPTHGKNESVYKNEH